MSSSAPSVSQLEPLVKRLQKIDTQLTGRTGTAAGSSLNDLVASLEAIASSLDGQKCQKTGADVCHCKSAPATTTSPTPAPASSVPTAGRCPKNGTLVCHCNDKPKSAAGAHAGSGSAYGVNKDAPTKPAASTPAAAPAPAPAAVAPKPATPAPVASTSTSTTSSSSSGPHYSHDQLKAGLPAGVDPKNKELHLEDHVFESLFKMSKEAWGKVAGWKKEIEKKKHGLF